MILCISVVCCNLSLLISNFIGLIFLPFFLMSLASGLQILLIFSKNQLLVLLSLLLFPSFLFHLFLLWFLWSPSFCWFWGIFVLVFYSCFIYRLRLSIRCFSCFLRYDCITINFPLRTAFAASHRFWFVMFSLSFVSRNVLISHLISSITYWLFRNVLFNLHVFVFLIFSLIIDI